MAKQVIFTHHNDKVEAGILTDNKIVICGSNGFEIPADDCVILTTYSSWERFPRANWKQFTNCPLTKFLLSCLMRSTKKI